MYSQEDFEYYYPDLEFNDINLVIGSADDAKYTCWFYGYLLDMSFSEVLDMLSHKGSDIDSYSEFDLGTYYYIVYSIDEFGNATGEYKVVIVGTWQTDMYLGLYSSEQRHAEDDKWRINIQKGITKGTSATTFSPDATCTRAQIVTFLYRYMV